MYTLEQYRAKASECGELVKTSIGSNEKREFQRLEQSFNMLANNEQWLADNYQNTLRTPQQNRSSGAALAEEEKRVLQCLGAALILQWNTLPTKLRREFFDNAGSMDEVLKTAALRGQIARFLHKHKNDEASRAVRPIDEQEDT